MITVEDILAGALAVPEPATQVQPLASEGLIQLWRQAARSDLTTLVLPEAVKTLHAIITDPAAKAAARVQASKIVLEHTLANLDDSAQKKAIHAMTADEITRAIAALKEELRERPLQLTRSHEMITIETDMSDYTP